MNFGPFLGLLKPDNLFFAWANCFNCRRNIKRPYRTYPRIINLAWNQVLQAEKWIFDRKLGFRSNKKQINRLLSAWRPIKVSIKLKKSILRPISRNKILKKNCQNIENSFFHLIFIWCTMICFDNSLFHLLITALSGPMVQSMKDTGRIWKNYLLS